ncbi:MAG: helix-turn-helix domain-containing protein [Candidatus Absconditicoccaceae bacterium]
MNSELILTLQSYGFSDKEAKVYLVALELGSSPASTIARNTAIKRVTVYTIIKDLKIKGAITEQQKDGVDIFSATNPSVLMKSL